MNNKHFWIAICFQIVGAIAIIAASHGHKAWYITALVWQFGAIINFWMATKEKENVY